ncbi:hypothetical protein IKP85_01200 [bacterium]|nr:hypothetical protein [bacterium]
MKLYPVYERVSLYLIPITLVLITLPLNYIAYNRKIYSIFVILLTFLGLSAYNLSYAKTLLKNDLFYKTDARTTMKVLLEQYNPSDYVIINRASDSEFEYYKHYYNIDIKHFAIVQLPEYSKENYFDILDQLPANNNYLFYYPNDYSHSPVIPFLKEWSKKQKILFDKEVNGSYLIYLHKLH